VSADIVRFQKTGTPRTLLENALEECAEYEFMIMVAIRKDARIDCQWSTLPSNIAAVGAVEFLKQRLME